MNATNESTVVTPKRRTRRFNPVIKTEFRVVTSRACMPNSCWGTYTNTAVMECLPGMPPRMISRRAVACVRIVSKLGPSFEGKTKRCAAEKDYAACRESLEHLKPSKIRFSKLRPSQQQALAVDAVARFLRSLAQS